MSEGGTDLARTQTSSLWLQALRDLDPRHADDPWYRCAHDVALSLRAAADDDRSLMMLVNQALVLQQFLLEVASRPTRVHDRNIILRQAGRLLDDSVPLPV